MRIYLKANRDNLTWFAGLLILIIGGAIACFLPLWTLILVTVFASYSESAGAVTVAIGVAERIALVIVGGAILPWTAVVAGLYRTLLEAIQSRRYVLFLHVLAAGGFSLMLAQSAKGSIEAIVRYRGDSWMMVAFVVVWVLGISYLCKVPWDQTRDAWSKWFGNRRKHSNLTA